MGPSHLLGQGFSVPCAAFSVPITTAPTFIPLGAALKGICFMMGQETTGWEKGVVLGWGQRLRWLYRWFRVSSGWCHLGPAGTQTSCR